MAFNIVLVEPEIPSNTGNIARTCGALGANLHLVHPLGFKTEDKFLKRAGLDYWHLVNITHYENLDDFFAKNPNANFYLLSTKAKKLYTEANFKDGDFFLFGKETKGLPEKLIFDHLDCSFRIPMRDDFRSLNLANSVAIVAYEAFRQINQDKNIFI